ncbi:MAG TPA: winged helix-turn-helix domain-containing protein [Candidatus Acidoferrum sp.]|nr:winged helix-turn-helix domain-containing protein [Candidatus Acidoferrum sp.]
MAENPAKVICFGSFETDLRAGELRRDGRRIRLQEQPFQVLAMLLQLPGEIVTREELRGRLWPADTFVDFDHGLNAAVKRLRDALNDSAENPRFVETVARRGYRFIAPIQLPGGGVAIKAVPVASRRRYWRIVPAGAALLIAGVMVGWHAGHRSVAAVRVAERRLTSNPENDPVISAAISPDGKMLAFADRTGVFLRQVGTGETHPIGTQENAHTYYLSWFPDASHVLTTRAASPSEPPSLWSVSVFGGTPRRIMDAAERGIVSPDGSQIVFLRGDYGHQEIWKMRANGEQAHKILGDPGDNIDALVWSPDGRRIAYVVSRYQLGWDDAEVALYIRDIAGGDLSRVLSSPRLRSALAWTPDGRLIYSLSELPPNSQNDTNLWAVRVDSRGVRTWGTPTRLTNGADAKVRASISADGKKLIFVRGMDSAGVYVTEVEGAGDRLSPLHRLSLDERRNFPYTWTPDGKSVIFTSDRDGVFHLFKQGVDQPAPDLLVGGEQSVILARLNTESSAILYAVNPEPSDADRRIRMMRLPLTGGTPQFVLQDPGINNFQCARAPATVCVLSEFTGNQLEFFTFNEVTGEKKPLTRIEGPEWYLQNWTLSPDGSMLAMSKKHRVPGPAAIRLYFLADGKEKTLTLKNWSGIASIDWAANGRSIWASASSPAGMQALLNVDLHGQAKAVLQEPEKQMGWAIPSADGRHLAIWQSSGSSNAWLLEGF